MFYLKSVEKSDGFQEIREVIDRYETLTTNYKDLIEIQKENEDKMNDMRRTLNAYLDKKNYEILSMNNELSELQTKLDHAQNEAHKAENDWNHIQATAAGKTLLIGETRMALRNLYQLVTLHQRRDEATGEEEKLVSTGFVDADTDQQLNKVEEFVNDLTKITNEISKEGYTFYAPPSSQ